ncbi:MAG: hypothetical protein AB7P03_05755 [Kofleriaceae bacterium]
MRSSMFIAGMLMVAACGTKSSKSPAQESVANHAIEPTIADCKDLLRRASSDNDRANVARKAEIDRCAQSYRNVELIDCVLKLPDPNVCIDSAVAQRSAHSDEPFDIGLDIADVENIGPSAPNPDDPIADIEDRGDTAVAMALEEGRMGGQAPEPKPEPKNAVVSLKTGNHSCDEFLSTINRCDGITIQTRKLLAPRLISVFENWSAMTERRRELLSIACESGRDRLAVDACERVLDQAMSAVATR